MSLSRTTSFNGPVPANGATDYPFTFVVQEAAHVAVERTEADGTTKRALRSFGTGAIPPGTQHAFRVTLNSDGTGTVHLSTAYADGTILIEREIPYDQPTTLSAQTQYRGNILERIIDRLVLQIQQARDSHGAIVHDDLPPDIARRSDIPEKALDADVDGMVDDTKYMTVEKVFRAIARSLTGTNVKNLLQGLPRNDRLDYAFLKNAPTSRIDAVENARVPAKLRIFPEARESIDDIEGTYTAVLDGIQRDLLFDNVNPAINAIRIIEVRSGTHVHDAAWSYVGGDLEIQFAINAQEAADIRRTGRHSYIAFYVEFRNANGSVADTDQIVVAIGNESEFPTSRRDIDPAALEKNPNIRWPSGKLPDEIVYADEMNAALSPIQDALSALSNMFRFSRAPFSDIRIRPSGLSGANFPESIFIVLNDKQTTRIITGISMNFAGEIKNPHAATPASSFRNANATIVRFDFNVGDRNSLMANHGGQQFARVSVTFSFDTGPDYTYNLAFPVNNPASS